MSLRVDTDNIPEPFRNFPGVINAYDKIGCLARLDKTDRKPLLCLAGGVKNMPLVPFCPAVNKSNIEVVIVAMEAGVDINIEVGKAFFDNAHIAPKGAAFGNGAVLLGENAVVVVELPETYPDIHKNGKQYQN